MYGDVAYEERFEAAVKSKDTAVLCPSRPGPKGMTCRFMRKAAKSPVVKSSARRAASQMEFRISPSAYDEARISARRMHDLLSDGQETWREWLVRGRAGRVARSLSLSFSSLPPCAFRLCPGSVAPNRVRPRREPQGPEKDMDGAWGFVGDGSHALTAAILMYRTGWCARVSCTDPAGSCAAAVPPVGGARRDATAMRRSRSQVHAAHGVRAPGPAFLVGEDPPRCAPPPRRAPSFEPGAARCNRKRLCLTRAVPPPTRAPQGTRGTRC